MERRHVRGKRVTREHALVEQAIEQLVTVCTRRFLFLNIGILFLRFRSLDGALLIRRLVATACDRLVDLFDAILRHIGNKRIESDCRQLFR